MSNTSIKSVHFIGVGGVGMSGIARVAHAQGMHVTGSDMKESRYTLQLKEAGIDVRIGAHSGDNIPGTNNEDGPDVVVVTTAVLDNNPELLEAKKRGLTIWHRAQMLARLGEGLQTVAIAGTHGKTTTSSMVASAMDAMGLNPTFLIGGIVRAYGTNAHWGTGEHYVVEADESDKSFRHLSPAAVLVTNIEADHLDHYRDLNEIHEKFAAFMASTEENGPLVVCGEESDLVKIARSTGRDFLTYGFAPGVKPSTSSDDPRAEATDAGIAPDEFDMSASTHASALHDDQVDKSDHPSAEAPFDITIVEYELQGLSATFKLRMPDGRIIASGLPQSPGIHNVLNAAGALALIDALGFSAEKAASALQDFRGVKRRFDLVGCAHDVTVVDDYAHHPTEIAATLAAAKSLGYSRVHVLFQPHRYSRASLFCEVLHDEFGAAFDDADTVTFMDVYSAGEVPIPGISGKTFLQPVLDHAGHPETHYISRRIEVVPSIVDLAKPGDLIITMGAGDVSAMGVQIIDALNKQD